MARGEHFVLRSLCALLPFVGTGYFADHREDRAKQS
jgi:hypothetical protein